MSNVAAFFDLDRTLIDVNSGLMWAKHEWQRGDISWFQLARAGFWTLMYHFAWIDMKAAYDSAAEHYEGEPFDALRSRTREWFYDEIEDRLRPGAEDALETHRDASHQLVVLTNSSCFEAAVAADAWGLDDWIANEFPTDDEGRLLGEFESPLCYGEGKVVRARAWSSKRSIDLEDSYFYSDSYSDLPMLEAVGHPRIVHPDPRLKREAESRDWPVFDWS